MKWKYLIDLIKKHPFLFVFLFVFYLIIVFGGIAYQNYEDEYSVSPEQARLLIQVKEWGNKSIKSILVEPYEPMGKIFKKEILNPIKLKKVPKFLSCADTKPAVGGHVQTQYECTLTFVSKDGSSFKVLAQICSDKPNDAYLGNNFWTVYKDGTYGQWGMKEVYVPGFGDWLIRNALEGIR